MDNKWNVTSYELRLTDVLRIEVVYDNDPDVQWRWAICSSGAVPASYAAKLATGSRHELSSGAAAEACKWVSENLMINPEAIAGVDLSP